MGFLRQAYDGMPPHNHIQSNNALHTKRKRRVVGIDRFAFLKRCKPVNTTRRTQATATANRNIIQLIDKEDNDDFGDIPRSISTTLDTDRLLLPRLLSSAPSFESIGSPCEMMRKGKVLISIDENEIVVDKLQSIIEHQDPRSFPEQKQQKKECDGQGRVRAVSPGNKETMSMSMNKQLASKSSGERVTSKDDKETIAKLQNITQQPPSLAHLSQYILALSSAISPNPSGSLPSRALRCLVSLSEHSSHREQRIAMVRDDVTLVPALLSFLKRCPSKFPINQQLVLLVLNNLSIPAENKRLIALDHNGSKILGQLLGTDPECQMLVIIIVNLTFGDERYPLVDPEDPITRRMVARVVSFLDLWRERGLPMDFRPLYGVNTGLCTM